MDKKIITRNFSKYARYYDQYASAQRLAAGFLLKDLKVDKPDKILELGCGTGNYTLLLKEKFPEARLTALDISPEMVKIANEKLPSKGVDFIVADAENVKLEGDFDMITSNACFQWFNDLGASLIKYKKLLKKQGIILFSMFGPLTFWELDISLKCLLKEASIEASGFIEKRWLRKILDDNFSSVRITELCYEESFSNLGDLLRKIKYTGTRGNGLADKSAFNRKLLGRLEKAYLARFKGIPATYQIFFCRVRL